MPLIWYLLACTSAELDRDGDGLLDRADCRPLDPASHPGAAEECNGLDDDCDGTIDEDLPVLYADEDGDGFGAAVDCQGTAQAGDCDDDDAAVHPGAADGCDGVDDDCDGIVDQAWDQDGDGASPCGGDCDDTDPNNRPGNPELCDRADNDCDGLIDEGFDADGDGWASCRGDCADGDPARNPGNAESCNGGVDDDCDETTTEDGDYDGDGQTWCAGDCNDFDGTISSLFAEACGDGKDNDCNGYSDDTYTCYGCYAIGEYVICQGSATFDTADHVCSTGGKRLAVIDDDEDAYTLGSTVYYGYVWWTQFWVGATDRVGEGDWRWIDGNATRTDLWYPGQPDNYGAYEHCALMNYGDLGRWNDAYCDYAYPFLCR